MVDIDLSSTQRKALLALTSRYRSEGSRIKAEAVAEDVDRAPETVRDVMRGLRDLSLVRTTEGPKGGYEPTARAYEVLGDREGDGSDSVTLAYDYERLDVTVEEIALLGVNHPERCRARVRLQRLVKQFDEGDAVVFGPIPATNLVVAGEILAVDETNSELVLEIAQLETLSGPDRDDSL